VSYAKSTSIEAEAIPIIDIGGLGGGSTADFAGIAAQFLHAAKTVGFFYIRNHGIPRAVIDDAFAVSLEFFSRTLKEKESVHVSERHRGFLCIGQAKMRGSATKDLKESFIWGREFHVDAWVSLENNAMLGRNQWPAFIPRMPGVLNDYFERCVALGQSLLRVFAAALDVDAEYFTGAFDRTISRGSSLYYPPQPPDLGDKQFGVAPHTDYGCLTLLYQDSVGGLQVRGAEGTWINAVPVPDTFVVNVGDLLARWTNNRFRSTPHRVINESGRARQSLAVFVDPNFETPISPVVALDGGSLYAPTTCGAYVLSRFDKSFSYRTARA
jgi:isopenicillin N synthase-like dioxygenase